ncbi:Gfo/Idh/MocA family oxidoreductase [soil metagenome]
MMKVSIMQDPNIKLRCAVIGTGFWANYQIAAWLEIAEVQIVALYNRTKNKAEAINEKFGLKATVYDDYEALLKNETIDFVDIITDVDSHEMLTLMAAKKGIHVVCQKPMAATFKQASNMVETCKNAGVKFFIHENFRWQAPIRKIKTALDSGVIGKPFKARVSFCSAFPVFDNQPFLATLDRFILMDIGSHVLDICRFLFGEVRSLYCLSQRVNPTIKGEDVANALMEMNNGMHCYAEMSYASILEKEAFPQTLVLIEGEKGSLQLTNDFELKVITRDGVIVREIINPKMYNWLDPAYAVVHSSIVDCNVDILNGLKGGFCETTGADNLKTVALVWKSYESATAAKKITV